MPVKQGSLDLLQLPRSAQVLSHGALAGTHLRFAAEYVRDLNYQANSHSVRLMLSLTGYVMPGFPGWSWN
jgi:hypothetical protein